MQESQVFRLFKPRNPKWAKVLGSTLVSVSCDLRLGCKSQHLSLSGFMTSQFLLQVFLTFWNAEPRNVI
jgi:hypothetical protein